VGCNSSVGIATRYGMNGRGSNPGARRVFSQPSRPSLGPTEPPVKRGLFVFLGVKVAGAWRWSFTPSNGEIKERVDQHLLNSTLFIPRVNFTVLLL